MDATLPLEPPTPPAAAPWKPRFFSIWTGQAFSLFGSQLVQFALIWYLTERTQSGTVLSTAALAGLLPQVFLSPLIGTLVDRWNRRGVMIVADGFVAAATLLLAVLFALNRIEVWHIYALLFARAVGGGFHQSAMGASMVLLVPKAQLARVQGLNQALRGGMDIAAAPLGALLLTLLPMPAVLAIDIGTAALAILPLLIFTLPQPERATPAAGKPSVWQDMLAGLRYVLGWPGLVLVLAMVLVINFLLVPAFSLLPLLVTAHFKGDAWQLSWLNAALGAGTIAGGLILGAWGGFKRRVLTALVGLIGLGLAILLVGATPPGGYWFAVAALGAAGLMTPIVNGSFGATLQASIAPEMQGRVFALILSVANALGPIGLVLAGPLADRFGVPAWFIVGGAVCAALGALGFFLPPVLNFEGRITADAPATIQTA
jgi:DHA3 family macrolide efflux protein-like MFS transporter